MEILDFNQNLMQFHNLIILVHSKMALAHLFSLLKPIPRDHLVFVLRTVLVQSAYPLCQHCFTIFGLFKLFFFQSLFFFCSILHSSLRDGLLAENRKLLTDVSGTNALLIYYSYTVSGILLHFAAFQASFCGCANLT